MGKVMFFEFVAQPIFNCLNIVTDGEFGLFYRLRHVGTLNICGDGD